MSGHQKEGWILSLAIAALLTTMLVGCRSSPVEPGSQTTMHVSYSIPNTSHVTIRIVNSYNTIVSTLVDSTQSRGVYSISWDTADYPSGVYFYYFSIVPEGNGAPVNRVTKFVIGE